MQQIPASELAQQIVAIHRGECPKCHGRGPVDVHMCHQVWSALVLTSWKSVPQLSCRSCGIKSQLGYTAFSLAFGWWGIPWGIFATPVQVIRNVASMLCAPDPSRPSRHLQDLVCLMMAQHLK